MYSATVMDHFGNPRNVGVLPSCTHKGVSGDPNAGPFVVLYLEIHEGIVRNVSYQTYGCAAAIAAGSYLTELIKGRSVEESKRVEWEEIQRGLGGLPLGKEHCAQSAVSALRNALAPEGVKP